MLPTQVRRFTFQMGKNISATEQSGRQGDLISLNRAIGNVMQIIFMADKTAPSGSVFQELCLYILNEQTTWGFICLFVF